MGKVIFTPFGYQAHLERMGELDKAISIRQREHATTDRPEHLGGHDNYITPEWQRDDAYDRTKLAEITGLLSNCEVAELPTDTERLRVGHVATIQRHDEQGHVLGGPEQYLIVGYQEGDFKSSPPSISYDAPIVEQLYGRRVDPTRDPAPVRLNGKRVYVELLKIELPNEEHFVKLKAA